MNAQELKEALSISDIVTFVTMALGSNGYKEDNMGNPIFQTIDHNAKGQGKYKLYYYDDRKLFVSYTGDGVMDIFELVQKSGHAKNFKSAFRFVAEFFGYDPLLATVEKTPEAELTSDWDLINKYHALGMTSQAEDKVLHPLSRALVEYFPNLQPVLWEKEGIGVAAMKKFGIRMDTVNEKIILPHYDINGHLIGIRGRAFNWFDLERGAKYSPIYIGKSIYNHPLGENLYGLFENQDVIRSTKKCIIFESEKSVLFMDTYYPNQNYSVAVCGSSITQTQVKLILSQGVSEVIIAFDKENDDFSGSELTREYRAKLVRLASLFAPYVNTYYLFDTYGKLHAKDSPADRGRETWEFLLEHKIAVPAFNTLMNIKGRK